VDALGGTQPRRPTEQRVKILRLRGIEAAEHARGHVVVIDVLRAFTTVPIALARGAERVVLVATADEGFALRAGIPGARLCGELNGRKIEGFDHGNSPEELEQADLAGRTLILRSTSGTQGVVRSVQAQAIVLGSLVVASATARWLTRKAEHVTLLACGSPGEDDADEDEACADLLESCLRGERIDPLAAVERVHQSPAGRRALDPAVDWISAHDLELACEVDRFDFCLPLVREEGLWVARPLRA
jgi:2-phosphosulfolactate phosphatase